ncbi:MAG TPA: hypothetical protein VGF13_00385 [Verrucomicrobiae bacterium]
MICNAVEEVLPRIMIDKVPLADAIRNLARQSGFNYILDPRLPGSDFSPGRTAPNPPVSGSWTNVSAPAALHALLKEHKLVMVTNPATSVTRIAPANQNVKPVSASQVGTNAGAVIPLMVMDIIPLTDTLTTLGIEAGLKISLDPALSAPGSAAHGMVSIRWERITARQALAALLDNFNLVMTEDAATFTAKISTRPDAK